MWETVLGWQAAAHAHMLMLPLLLLKGSFMLTTSTRARQTPARPSLMPYMPHMFLSKHVVKNARVVLLTYMFPYLIRLATDTEHAHIMFVSVLLYLIRVAVLTVLTITVLMFVFVNPFLLHVFLLTLLAMLIPIDKCMDSSVVLVVNGRLFQLNVSIVLGLSWGVVNGINRSQCQCWRREGLCML